MQYAKAAKESSEGLFKQSLLKVCCRKSKTTTFNIQRLPECNLPGLQIIFQNLSDILSRRNEILSDIYKNLSNINIYKNLIKS